MVYVGIRRLQKRFDNDVKSHFVKLLQISIINIGKNLKHYFTFSVMGYKQTRKFK
jgi:hypothetical protein